MAKKKDHDYFMMPMGAAAEESSPKRTMRQRGLLDASPRPISNTLESPFRLGKTRYWRWWNYLTTLVVSLTAIEAFLLIVSTVLVNRASESVSFTLRKYPHVPYHHLDTTTPITLTEDSTVYHVTKEFGPATMGGMGSVLTAITQAQLLTGKITPHVVLPYYSFLKKQQQYPIRKTVDLVITVRNGKGESAPVEFKVSELAYDFYPVDNFDLLSEEEQAAIKNATKDAKTITVYLIGPGKSGELRKAFRANSITQIYSSPKELPQEWKDQYYDKAVASFLIWKSAGKHEQSLFAPLELAQPRVDVVHLHGATNAYVAKYLNEFEKQMGPTLPSIVYTMHDYLDELQYINTLENVKKFLNTPRNGRSLQQDVNALLVPYTFGKSKVFMSPMAVDMADVVTFVSRSMAQDMVEGRLDFYLKEVVMDNLLRKAEMKKFFGISNGVDFDGSINPFTEQKLMEHGLNYPSHAKSLINQKLGDTTAPNSWTLLSPQDFVTESKRRAKQYLIDQGLLHPADINRPLVLFVGRFQYNKGLETFREAAELFKLHDIKFAIIGQPNNYPLKWVQSLAADHPQNIVLMTRTAQQKDWLIYFRAAADFVYVPSITESFGLVAAEGLMFGSSVISTGTGGLAEFLVDRQVDDTKPQDVVSGINVESYCSYNAYIFDFSTKLAEAIGRAAADFQNVKTNPLLHEVYVLRMMKSAYGLGWDRGNDQGPVYDYLRVYQMAIDEKRASSSFDMDGKA